MLLYPEYTIADYLDSKDDIAAKIAAIDVIIAASLTLLANTVSGIGGNIEMYELDDGQVKIKTNYRSIDQVTEGITGLRKLRNVYKGELRGRASVLQDKRTFRGSGGTWI
jgi:hypothetical protein